MAFKATANGQYVSGPATGFAFQKGGVAFWMKTSSTNVDMVPISRWQSNSRQGWGFIINNSPGKIAGVGYSSGPPAMSCNSTGSVNDGNWHHILLNFDGATSGAGQMYIDGVPDGTNSLTGTWALNPSGSPLALFDNNDGYWPTFIGSLAEMVEIYGRNFTAGEIAALAKGYSPRRVVKRDSATTALAIWPMVRDMITIAGAPTGVVNTAQVDDHPRIYA